MGTETTWEGHLTGLFEGYAYDQLFALSNGTKWRQACTTREHVYREQPAARLVREPSTGRVYLDVAGTSASVLVERSRGNDRRTHSAYQIPIDYRLLDRQLVGSRDSRFACQLTSHGRAVPTEETGEPRLPAGPARVGITNVGGVSVGPQAG